MAGKGGYAKYNGYEFDYVKLTVNSEPVMQGSAVTRYNRTYTFFTVVKCATYALFAAARVAIAAALEEPGKTLTIYDVAGTPNATWSFAATDCVGDGPIVSYSIPLIRGYNFDLEVTVKGGVPPQGGATPTDIYTDEYAQDIQERQVRTRSGTRRVTTAFSGIETALDGVDPSPGANWEYVDRRGTFDKAKKQLDYTYIYREWFEKIPAGFKDVDYAIDTQRNGRRKDIAFNATAKIDHKARGTISALPERLEQWGRGKMPEGAEILEIGSNLDKRNGSCSLSITAVAPVTDDTVEWTETVTETRSMDVVMLKRLGGGGTWKQEVGDPDYTITANGRKVGLHEYPAVRHSGDESSKSQESPYKGPDGELLYAVTYSNAYVIAGKGKEDSLDTGDPDSNGGIGLGGATAGVQITP